MEATLVGKRKSKKKANTALEIDAPPKNIYTAE